MFSTFADSVLGFLEAVLTFLHDLVEPVTGLHSWGWAIVLLTVIVRVLLLPLAIKQTRSMRAMQAIQPQMKEIQKKYKVDRELMKKDPQRYREKKQQMNQEMMALYQKESVNPAASCLPLLAQAPVFIALFWAIRGMEELENAPFYFFTSFISAESGQPEGLGALASTAGWPGWLLILVMSGTLFISQKQMMARTAATQGENPMAQQQKILLYAMPVILAVVSFQFPLGLVVYWATTNFWQVAQQWIILREVKQVAPEEPPATKEPRPRPGGGGATSGKHGRKPTAGPEEEPDPAPASDDGSEADEPAAPGSTEPETDDPQPPAADEDDPKRRTNGHGPAGGPTDATPKSKRDHLPRRRRRDR